MQLTVVGGGGFRVPQMYRALLGDPTIDHLVLVDTDARRLGVVASVVEAMRATTPPATPGPRVTVTTDLAAALTDADFVFSAIRVDGTHGRVLDEQVALRHGVIGQETVGVGGMAYALRTIPVARELAAAVLRHAPDAWTINFTNPAGVITEAMREVLGDRVIGICDTPIGLVNRVGAALGTVIDDFDYVGINHLGWLRSASSGGRDLLPTLLADDTALAHVEEAHLFGVDLIRSIGALPNEYLFHYWFTRESLARLTGRETRGRYLDAQQEAFYAAAAARPERALATWEAALGEREATYGSEAREDPAARRDPAEIALGGYQAVALQLMRALAGNPTDGRPMVLNVPNAGAIAQLPDDAVVELPCRVDAAGVHRQPVAPVSGEMAGLMVQVKACDSLLRRATAERDPVLALRAFAAHPLVDSLTVARDLLADYREAIPRIAAALDAVPTGVHPPGRAR